MLWAAFTLLWLTVFAVGIVRGPRSGVRLPPSYRPIDPATEPVRYWSLFAGIMAFLAFNLAGLGLIFSGDEASQVVGHAISRSVIVALLLAWLVVLLRSGRIGNARRLEHPFDFWARLGALTIFFLLFVALMASSSVIDLRNFEQQRVQQLAQ